MLFIVAGAIAILNIVTIKSAAASPLVPDPGTTIPTSIHDSLTGCSALYPSTGRSPGLDAWISSATNSANQNISVTPGTTSISLRFNYAGAYCVKPSTTVESRIKVTTVVSPGVTGLLNQESALNFPGSSGPSGSYNGTSRVFTYNSPNASGFTTGDYLIKFLTKKINHFESGVYTCVTNGPYQDAHGGFNYQFCSEYPTELTIRVTVSGSTTAQIEGQKVFPDGTPGDIDNFGDDNIFVADCSTPTVGRTDSANPYGQTWNNLAANKCYTVTARNAKPGYHVIGSAWCDITGGMCPNFTNDPQNFPGTGAGGNGSFQPGTSRTLGNVLSGHDYDVYWVYEPDAPGGPKITMTCADNAGVFTLTGNAQDPDRSGSVSLQFYKDNIIISTGVTATSSSGDFSANVTPFMGSPAVETIFSVVATGVDANGNPDGQDVEESATCIPGNSGGGGGGPSPTTNCPGDPVVQASAYQPINPTAQNVPGDSGRTSGYSSTPASETGYTYTANGKYSLNYVRDQWGQNAAGTIPPLGTKSTGPFSADYSSWVNDYPYDSHTITASYQTYYNRNVYKSSSTASYDSSGTLLGYAISFNRTDQDQGNAAGTVNPHLLAECLQRTFKVHRDTDNPPTIAQVSISDPEDPDRADFSALIYVDFGFSGTPKDLRNPNKVLLNYAGTYFIRNSSGDTPISCGPSPSGQVTINGRNVASTNESATTATCTASFSGTSLKAGDRVCVRYDISPGGSQMDENGTVTLNDGTVVTAERCSDPITDKPYIHTLGLDSSAGGNFAAGREDKCVGSTPDPGTIIANIKDDGTALSRGSGDQFGALALGSITRFASATYRISAPTADRGLSFANPPRPAAAGNLGGQHCVPDFFSTRPSAFTPVSGNLNIGVYDNPGNPADRQVFYADSDLIINNAGGFGTGIAHGNRIAVYVKGDVYIDSDLKFKTTTWSDQKEVPSFFVIAKGNIYISPDVRQLDGVYVAQPSTTSDGVINTCAQPFGTFSSAGLYDSCKGTKLMVNGAFVARQVNFLRTANSLRNAVGGEYPTAAGNAGTCTGNVRVGTRSTGDTTHDCAAEIINFSPETYLSEPAMIPFGGPSRGKYDFITSLSPIL